MLGLGLGLGLGFYSVGGSVGDSVIVVVVIAALRFLLWDYIVVHYEIESESFLVSLLDRLPVVLIPVSMILVHAPLPVLALVLCLLLVLFLPNFWCAWPLSLSLSLLLVLLLLLVLVLVTLSNSCALVHCFWSLVSSS